MLNISVPPKPALLNWSNHGAIPSIQNQYAPAAKAPKASVQTQDGMLRPCSLSRRAGIGSLSSIMALESKAVSC